MPADDTTLLRRTHAGHEPSARELWRRHAGWMLGLARSVLGRRHAGAAEDVVQAVFCRLLALDRAAIRAVREPRPWLALLVRRQALNHLRTLRRAGLRERTLPTPATAGGGPHASDDDLARALAALPRRQREVLHLRHVLGLTTDQTALALGIPRGTVASRHHAAVEALRARLDPPAPPASDPCGEPTHAHAV